MSIFSHSHSSQLRVFFRRSCGQTTSWESNLPRSTPGTHPNGQDHGNCSQQGPCCLSLHTNTKSLFSLLRASLLLPTTLYMQGTHTASFGIIDRYCSSLVGVFFTHTTGSNYGAPKIQNGGVFHQGKTYTDDKKMQVVLNYLELIEDEGRAPCRRLAEFPGVGKTHYYAATVTREIQEGNIRLSVGRPLGIGKPTHDTRLKNATTTTRGRPSCPNCFL